VSATEARQRKNGCGRKVRYPSAEPAQAEAERLSQASGDELRAYLCPWTDAGADEHWHVGHALKAPLDLTPDGRIHHRLAIIAHRVDVGRRLTGWQHAYAEDVRWLLDRGSDDSTAALT
jgi:hypothetical protein